MKLALDGLVSTFSTVLFPFRAKPNQKPSHDLWVYINSGNILFDFWNGGERLLPTAVNPIMKRRVFGGLRQAGSGDCTTM